MIGQSQGAGFREQTPPLCGFDRHHADYKPNSKLRFIFLNLFTNPSEQETVFTLFLLVRY